jgi:glutamate racemase
MPKQYPIGVFDSGYGGLTILKELKKHLPNYDYVYLGDNARTPYGNRSFETVYEYTLQCVKWLFEQNCPLVILACNTASAKALRSIQLKDLPIIAPAKRVLGVIRPTAEIIGRYSNTKAIGVLATQGTVTSNSYIIEIAHQFPQHKVHQQACPMWVPLIENNEHNSPAADYFVKKYIDELLEKNSTIDTLLLACTHYPLLKANIEKHLPTSIQVVDQGEIVSLSLIDYLQRHPEIESQLTTNQNTSFYTTDDAEQFNQKAALFYGKSVNSIKVEVK